MKRFLTLFTVAMAFCLTACNQEELDDLKGRVEALENQTSISDIKSQISSLISTQQTLQSTLEKADLAGMAMEIGELKTANNQFKTQIEAAAKASDLLSLSGKVGELNSTIGTINQLASKIPDIESRLGGFTDTVNDCSTKLADISSSLSKLIDRVSAIVASIQSLNTIPGFTDGSVAATSSGSATFLYEVAPASAAERIVEAGKEVCRLDAVYTAVRSDGIFINLPVTSVALAGQGVISVTADLSALAGDKDAIKAGTKGASIRLLVTDGEIQKASDYANLAFMPARADGITLNASELKGYAGQKAVITATVTPEDALDKTVIWTSSNPDIAAVSDDGTVTFIKSGKASITATTKDGGYNATCEVTVPQYAVAELPEGTELRFWKGHFAFSSDKSKAYVTSDNGTLVAVDLATATVEWVYRHPDCTASAKQSGGVAVNPVTGDIFFTDRVSSSYCVSCEGKLKWKVDVAALGNCFALNSDATVLFLAGDNCSKLHAGKTSGSRYIGAFDTTTGKELAYIYMNENPGEFTGALTYTGYAQMLVPADDRLIVWGAEHYGAYSFTKTEGAYSFTRIAYVKTNAAATNYNKAQDETSPVVSPDKKKAYFATQGGMLGIVDLRDCSLEGAAKISGGQLYSPVLDNVGSVIVADNAGKIWKMPLSEVKAGADVSAATMTVPGSTGSAFQWMCPSCAADGSILLSSGAADADHAANLGGFLCIPSDAATAYLLAPAPCEVAAFQGVFAATDGYMIAASGSSAANGKIYVLETGMDLAATGWAYYGGDPCATNNVKWAYGSY